MKTFKIMSFSLFVLIMNSSCFVYNYFENQYQKDADIIRVHHFDYYAKLLTEYYELNGKYPFQYEKEVPLYCYILTSFQEERSNYLFGDRDIEYIDDKYFFEELSKGLNRNIDEKYDPQKVSTDGRPTAYIYMVDGDYFFFAIHLHNRNDLTKFVGKNYYKMELSNVDSIGSGVFRYETALNNPFYLEMLNREPKRNALFIQLDEEYKRDSKN